MASGHIWREADCRIIFLRYSCGFCEIWLCLRAWLMGRGYWWLIYCTTLHNPFLLGMVDRFAGHGPTGQRLMAIEPITNSHCYYSFGFYSTLIMTLCFLWFQSWAGSATSGTAASSIVGSAAKIHRNWPVYVRNNHLMLCVCDRLWFF